MTFSEVVAKLKNLKQIGFVKTHRSGPTGIGKTLEDLIGITENNIPGPDLNEEIELKSARKHSPSMLTLFTKSPLPKKANSVLLNELGYITSESKGKKILHTTVSGVNFNTLRGQIGLKIEVETDRLTLVCNQKVSIVAYWDKITLKKYFETKLPKLCYVKAESRNAGANEEFWFNEAYLLEGFEFSNLIDLTRKGDILVDIRIGQYPDGRAHDHGTGFRINPDKLDLCFTQRINLLD